MAYHGDIHGNGSFRTILKVLPIDTPAPPEFTVGRTIVFSHSVIVATGDSAFINVKAAPDREQAVHACGTSFRGIPSL